MYNIGWVAVWEVANPLIIGVAEGEILLELEGDMGCRYEYSCLMPHVNNRNIIGLRRQHGV